jgi:pilus assembly protein Flp/PilA
MMKKLKRILNDLVTDEGGQDMLEYALMAALLGLGTMAALRGTKNSTSNAFGGVNNALSSAAPATVSH